MIRLYFQQALYHLRENPIITWVSVLGTALAICMIMVLVITFQVRLVDCEPEVNRSRSLYVSAMSVKNKGGSDGDSSNARMSVRTGRECFKNLTTAEAVTLVSLPEKVRVSLPAGNKVTADMVQTDDAFWHIFRFRFLSGKAFTKADSDAGVPCAVLSAAVARRLFGTTDIAGKTVQLNYVEYRISGVVTDVSVLATSAYAQVWVPYTSTDIARLTWWEETLGQMRAVILARSAADFPAIREEAEQLRRKYNDSLRDSEVFYRGQPDEQFANLYRKWSETPDTKAIILRYMLVIAILLLVPAINLSSMTLSRMRRRMAEIGVRKAFGATGGELIRQIFFENLLLTLFAGVLGLALSYAATFLLNGFLFNNSTNAYLSGHAAFALGIPCSFRFLFADEHPFGRHTGMEGFENEYNGCDQSKVNDGYENDIETNKERVEQQSFLFVELLLVFVVLWYIVDWTLVTARVYHAPMGFDTEHCYNITVSKLGEDSPLYNPELTADDDMDDLLRLTDRLRHCPGVEAVAISQNCFPYNEGSNSIDLGIDSVAVNVRLLWVEADFFRVFRYAFTEEAEFAKVEAAFRNDEPVVSSNLTEGHPELGGSASLPGREVLLLNYGKDVRRRIGAVGTPVRWSHFHTPSQWGGAFAALPLNAKRLRNFGDPRYVTVSLRVSEDADKNFAEKLMNDADRLYQVGNLYLLDITPFSHLREICELEDMNEWKTQLCVLGFLLLNIFLGVIGTFWFRTQQRRKEVALRLALGSSRRGIFSCLMYEGVLLLTLAAVPAAVIAFNIGYAELVDVGKMPFDAGRFLPALALTWLLMALMIVAGIWYPAYGAMKVHPAEALHDE